jgi:transcriptional/translational regulatory protein YebC/TACO1
MAEAGAVAWQFQKKGFLVIDDDKVDEDQLLSLTLEAGAEDVKHSQTSFEVITSPTDFEAVKRALQEAQIEPTLSEITFLPQNQIKLEEKAAEQTLKLMEILDDHDDIQKVHANFDISEEIMEKMASVG